MESRLKIVAYLPPKVYNYGKYKMVRCECQCGNSIDTRLSKVVSKHTRSCGCLQIESVVRKNTTHGLSYTDSYKTWLAMNERCSAPNQKSWKYYGEKGIKVCARWKKFENFFNDMGDRPKDKTLDRIDNSQGYSKENCRWATAKEQANNKG